jgi:adenylylsulfate kinase
MDHDSDSHSRSFAKALSWRVFALAITTGVSYMLSASVAVAVSIGVVDSAIKIGAYYVHERAWMGIRFGRKQPAVTPRGA